MHPSPVMQVYRFFGNINSSAVNNFTVTHGRLVRTQCILNDKDHLRKRKAVLQPPACQAIVHDQRLWVRIIKKKNTCLTPLLIIRSVQGESTTDSTVLRYITASSDQSHPCNSDGLWHTCLPMSTHKQPFQLHQHRPNRWIWFSETFNGSAAASRSMKSTCVIIFSQYY